MPPTRQYSETSDIINIRHYLAILWHWAWLIALSTTLAGLSALIVSNQLTPIYRATTTVLVNEAPSSKIADYTSILTSERLTRTYAQMMTKQPNLMEVIKRLNLSVDMNELSDAISVQPVRDTQLIEISVDNPNPLEAALIANTLVGVFAEQVQTIQTERFSVSKQNLQEQLADMEQQIRETNSQISMTNDSDEIDRLEAKLIQQQEIYSTLLLSYEEVRLSETETSSNVVQVEPALPPPKPVRPKILVTTFIAAIMGMMLAVGSIVALEAFDDTIKTPDEVYQQLGIPVLAVIMKHPVDDQRPVTEAEPRSPISEAFRTLRTNVQYTSIDNPLQTIAVTSPTPSEGKTTIVSNLGIVLAQSGQRVTIIDCDLRKPTVHQKLNLRNHLGLSSIFVRPSIVLDGILQKTRIANLATITSGRLPPNPSELLGSQKMKNILVKIKEHADIVLIDTPPTLAVTDAAVLVPHVDGVLLVMRPGVTKLTSAKQAVEQLERMGANLIGVVLNNIKAKRSRHGMYYYEGYQSYMEYYSSDDGKKENSHSNHKTKS